MKFKDDVRFMTNIEFKKRLAKASPTTLTNMFFIFNYMSDLGVRYPTKKVLIDYFLNMNTEKTAKEYIQKTANNKYGNVKYSNNDKYDKYVNEENE